MAQVETSRIPGALWVLQQTRPKAGPLTWRLGHLAQFSPPSQHHRDRAATPPGRGARRRTGPIPAGCRAPGSPSLADAPQKPQPPPAAFLGHLNTDRAAQLPATPARPAPGARTPPRYPHRRARPGPPLPGRPHGNPSPRVPSADEPGLAQAEGFGAGGGGGGGGGEGGAGPGPDPGPGPGPRPRPGPGPGCPRTPAVPAGGAAGRRPRRWLQPSTCVGCDGPGEAENHDGMPPWRGGEQA